MQTTDEHELIKLSLDGDHRAYAELVNRYKRAVFHHCFALLKNEDTAEDIAQETFIIAYYKLGSYKPKYKLATWLFTIATNKSLTLIQRSRKMSQTSEEEQLQRLVSDLPSPEAESTYNELRRAVDKLPSRDQKIVTLYFWEGYSYQEIATKLSHPLGSIKVWMRRAKDRLKKDLL